MFIENAEVMFVIGDDEQPASNASEAAGRTHMGLPTRMGGWIDVQVTKVLGYKHLSFGQSGLQ